MNESPSKVLLDNYDKVFREAEALRREVARLKNEVHRLQQELNRATYLNSNKPKHL